MSPLITPILCKPYTDAESTEDGAEARMRQALGKLGAAKSSKPEVPRRAGSYQATPGVRRHRFKQDGEVPVVRLSLAQGGRSTERQAHAPVESAGARPGQAGEARAQDSEEGSRQVQELTEQLRSTQTRLGHAELALREAGREAQARQEEAAVLHRSLNAAKTTLAQVRAELAASERAQEELARSPRATLRAGLEVEAPEDTPARRKVGRRFGAITCVQEQEFTGEPTPVKW